MSEETTIQEETTDETIQQDVEKVESKDVEQKPVQLERDRMIEEMAKKRREQPVDETEDEEPEVSEDAEIDLKVDGQIVKMKKKEVDSHGGVAEAQKHLSAERRLHQAYLENQKLEKAGAEQRRREQALQQREAQLEARLKALEVKPQLDTSDDVDVDKFVQSVYSGDEDEAKESLREILKKMRSPQTKQTPQLNENDILNKALFEVEKRNGQREFTEKYPHLKQDPFLFDKTNHETIQIMNANPDWSPRDVIIEAAKRVDDWYKEKMGDKGIDTLQKRTESKQKVETIQSAQTRKQADTGYKKSTKDDIFEMYRKTRAK